MDVADIITEYGAYYLNQGQNTGRLVRQLREKVMTEELFTSIVTDDTLWQAAEVRIGRLLQPFQKAWTPLGSPEFIPIGIRQFKMKMDHEEYPDDISGTWLGFLEDENLDRSQWPFIKWLVENELLPGIKEDYENNEIFKGSYVAPTPGTPGAAGTAMDGIKTIRNAHIAAGTIVPITMGAFPSAVAGSKSVEYQVCEYFEDFANQINDKYWGEQMTIATSPTRERQFKRGYADKYGERVDYSKNEKGDVDFTNLVVKGYPSHRGSDVIWCTPKSNAIVLKKHSANMDRVRLETVDRKVKIFTDFYKGIGFVLPGLVFTNDLETA